MQLERRLIVGVRIDMLQPACVERARPPNNAMNLVAFGEQQLGKVRSILACDSRDQCSFRHPTLH